MCFVPARDIRNALINGNGLGNAEPNGQEQRFDQGNPHFSSLLNIRHYPQPMMSDRHFQEQFYYERSARRDIRAWGMFIIGTVFFYAGLTVDPRSNCSSSGECAPWLVPIALIVGAAIGLGGLGQLLANPRRGSRFDPESGVLIWWQNRVGTSDGDVGQIAPTDIGTIRIVKQSEGSDEIHLYDLNGNRQFYFDEEVIPHDQERWSKAMTDRWPHIQVEIVE